MRRHEEFAWNFLHGGQHTRIGDPACGNLNLDHVPTSIALVHSAPFQTVRRKAHSRHLHPESPIITAMAEPDKPAAHSLARAQPPACSTPEASSDAVTCERCGAEMFRMHAVWRCPRCRYKTDCCGW
jgi:hypothetical protein